MKYLRLILLGAVVFFLGCRERVVHDLQEMDAHRVISALHDRGIAAERELQADGRWAVTVTKSELSGAIVQLTSSRVLRGRSTLPTEPNGFLASREAQRFHFERSLSAELEGTLLALDGVLDARVHLNLPPTDPLLGRPLKADSGSASALLFIAPGTAIASTDVAGLIAGGSGIPREAITVVMTTELQSRAEPALISTEESHRDAGSATSRLVMLGMGGELGLGLTVGLLALGITLFPATLVRRRRRASVLTKLEDSFGLPGSGKGEGSDE